MQEDVQQHVTLALSDRDSFYEERACALSVMRSDLEDKHSEALRSLRENEDMVRCCGCPRRHAVEGVHATLHV
jgi:hypothetical protein